jgi:anti-anti-sigma factor
MKLNWMEGPQGQGKDDLIRITVEGNLTKLVEPDFDPLREKLGPNCYSRRVMLNMERVQAVDTSGITWLLGVVQNFQQANGKVIFYMMPPIVTQVLDFMRLTDTLPLAATEQAALGVANGTPVSPSAQ